MSDSITEGPTLDFTTQTTPSALDGGSASSAPFWGDVPDVWDTVFINGIRLPGLCKVSGKGFEQRVDKKRAPGKHGAHLTQTGNECADVEITVRMWTANHLVAFESLVRNHLKPRKATTSTSSRQVAIPAARTLALEGVTGVGGAFGERNDAGDAEAGSVPGFGGTGFAAMAKKLRDRPTTKTVTTTKVLAPAIGGAVPIYHPALAIFGIRSVVVLSATLPEPTSGGKGEYESKLKCVEFVSGAQTNGTVKTVTASASKIATLGPGAIGRRLATPAADNTGP